MSLLEVESLSVSYGRRQASPSTVAVEDVTFTVDSGEIVGLVGESGCGKTSVARALVGAVPPLAGTLSLAGMQLRSSRPAELRRRIQMVFQDPGSSLDPRLTVGRTLGFAASTGRGSLSRTRVAELLQHVGLSADVAECRPAQLSGGQRQRVAIARAIATEPDVIIADEIVASLDVSAAGAVLNLLRTISQTFGVAVLFISHDLAVVRNLCTRTLVMYLGQIVEQAPTEELFDRPGHPYTRALIESIPSAHERRNLPPLVGDHAQQPNQAESGCRFRARCSLATEQCATQAPALEGDRHSVRCHYAWSTTTEVP